MHLNGEQIKGILSELKEQGYDVVVRDISYVILCRCFTDHQFAFRSLFLDDPDLPFDLYDRCDKVLAIEAFLDTNYGEDEPAVVVKDAKDEKGEAISFDELKQGLIDDMKSRETLRDMKDEDGNPALEAKELATVVGRIADIRVRLTTKFGTTEKEDNHRIVVQSKYTKVCPHCGHEY